MEDSSKTVPSIVVYVTVPNREAGIESVYEWEGKVQSDSEELLIIKTRQSLLESLTQHVNANHEYDVPEVIALPITGQVSRMVEKQYKELRSRRLVAVQRQWLWSIGFFYISTSLLKINRVKCNTGPVRQMKHLLI